MPRRRRSWIALSQIPVMLAGVAAVANANTPVDDEPQDPTDAQAAIRDEASAVEPASTVTVRLDPSYQGQEFEGWGASLVWSANATGGYPDAIRNKLVDLVFGEDGLRLNIARYNIGGGNAPDVRDDYMKLGATMEGFWNAPEGTTREDMDWWDPDNPDHWNWDADANQRWWIDQIKDRVDHWEAFSNSPPWFQTINGYVSGPFTAGEDSIREDTLDDFGTYLVRVMEHLEDVHDIEFDTVDPLNEPNTTYWTTTLGPDGQPVGGRQEGVHAGPELQQNVIEALDDALQGAGTNAVISAMDETNPGTFLQNWNAYTDESKAVVDQMNVHTYGTGQRTAVRDLAKGDDKRLWMSEVEGSFHSPTDYTTMETGLGIASRIVNDLRELEPSAWVLWQPIEDTGPQVEGGGNWGSIHVPFDCTADDTLETCPIQTNTKFDTIRNFTHYIRPGDHLIKVDDTSSTAAISQTGESATVVHVNSSDGTRAVTLDLSLFGHIASDAAVTPVVSSADGGLVTGDPVAVAGAQATLTVPANSVTTLVIDGVRGIAKDAALVRPGHVYRLEGVGSGRSLTPEQDGTGLVINTNDPSRADQLWQVEKLTSGHSNRERYTLANAESDQRLALRDGILVVEDVAGEPDAGAQWIMSSTGDGTWTLVNVASGRLVDVSGHATADGSPVTTWTPTAGSNQRWTVIDETIDGFEAAEVFTTPGVAPELPTTVTARLHGGTTADIPVSWEQLPDARWKKPGRVRVPGVATDARGTTYDVHAIVTVDVITATEPARTKTYVGGAPELPDHVVGVGDHGGRSELPVTWDQLEPTDFSQPGVVTVNGVAVASDARELDATVRVQVTEPVETNVATDDGVTTDATYTEPGYSTAGLRNGDTGEKAWSNWKPGDTKNPSETITFTLPEEHDVSRVVTHFYLDGGNTSVAESLRVEARAADGTWADVSGEIAIDWDGSTAPVVDVPVVAHTDAVRVVLAARPSGYLTISEIEVSAATPGESSDATAASIEVNGEPISGFDPDVADYRVQGAPGNVDVTATATDPYATIDIRQGAQSQRRLVFVTVVSEDRTQVQEYRIELTP